MKSSPITSVKNAVKQTLTKSFWSLLIVLMLSACGSLYRSANKSDRTNTKSIRNENSSDSIAIWSSDYKIKIEDFWLKKRPTNATNQSIGFIFVASTYNHDSISDNIILKVVTELYRNRSWVDTVDRQYSKETFLSFMQGVFDIQEVISRMIRKDLSELPPANFDDQWLIIQDRAIDIAGIQNIELQKKFREETSNGYDREQLIKWRFKIDSLLLNYSQYTIPNVRVRFTID